MFHLSDSKMRQDLTFLATIENDHHNMNVGRDFDSRMLAISRGSFRGPASDKRSGRTKGELGSPSEAAFAITLGGDDHAFGGSIS
jgi:hypothetical protein